MQSQGQTSHASSRTNANRGRRNTHRIGKHCYCNVPAKFDVSWSDKNPGRPYYGCRYFPKSSCGFFEWVDDEQSDWYKMLITDLKANERGEKEATAMRFDSAAVNVNPDISFLVKVMIGLLVILITMVGTMLFYLMRI